MSRIQAPQTNLLPDVLHNQDDRRSNSSLKSRDSKFLDKKAALFWKTADRIKLPFTLDLLRDQKKVVKANLEAECRRLESLDAQVVSAVFIGSDDVPILAYCSNRVVGEGQREFTIDNQFEGRTAAGFEERVRKAAEAEVGAKPTDHRTFDGIPIEKQFNFYVASQTMASASRGHTKPDLLRHGYKMSMDYMGYQAPVTTDTEVDQEPSDDNPMAGVVNPEAHEPLTGVASNEASRLLHLVHGWIQRGHKNGGLYISKDLVSSSTASAASRPYYKTTAPVHEHIARYHAKVFPDWQQRYERAFAAGQMFSEDPGPFLGRALIYKLQGKLHKDKRDAGTSISFGVGHYSGGHLYIPQLRAKFEYSPGSFCMFFSSLLFHKVGLWEPLPQTEEMKKKEITPGRLGTVFFFPEPSLVRLDGQRPGWAADTGLGYNKSMGESEPLGPSVWDVDEQEVEDLLMES